MDVLLSEALLPIVMAATSESMTEYLERPWTAEIEDATTHHLVPKYNLGPTVTQSLSTEADATMQSAVTQSSLVQEPVRSPLTKAAKENWVRSLSTSDDQKSAEVDALRQQASATPMIQVCTTCLLDRYASAAVLTSRLLLPGIQKASSSNVCEPYLLIMKHISPLSASEEHAEERGETSATAKRFSPPGDDVRLGGTLQLSQWRARHPGQMLLGHSVFFM